MNFNSLKYYLKDTQADEDKEVLVYIPHYRRVFELAATDLHDGGLVLITQTAPIEANFTLE